MAGDSKRHPRVQTGTEVPLPDRAATCKAASIKPIRTELMYNNENLAKLKKMNNLAPQVMQAFWAFDKISRRRCAHDYVPVLDRYPQRKRAEGRRQRRRDGRSLIVVWTLTSESGGRTGVPRRRISRPARTTINMACSTALRRRDDYKGQGKQDWDLDQGDES